MLDIELIDDMHNKRKACLAKQFRYFVINFTAH